MPPFAPKAVFALVLVSNFVLWSQSRYGDVQSYQRSQLSNRSLASLLSTDLSQFDNHDDEVCSAFPLFIL
jgi:hypothetical protein